MRTCKYGAKVWDTLIRCDLLEAGLEPPCSDCRWNPDLKIALAALHKAQDESLAAEVVGGRED